MELPQFTGISSWLLSRWPQLLLVLIAAGIGSKLYQGISIRMKFRRMKAQGIPMLEHSWLLGHLPFVYGWTRQNPKDTHIFRLMYHVLDNYQRLFPGQETLPPVLYLDLWPIETPLMIVFDPAVTAQFTQETSLPKHSVLTEIMIPLTKGKDLNTISGEPWRYWRSRFNPGFSARNTMALLPEVIEEIVVFAGKLDNYAGPDGQWGRAFQMETETVNLTFDVIGRAILDARLHEQSGKSSTLKLALMDSSKRLDIGFRPFRVLQPFNLVRRWRVARNDRIMWRFFEPYIQRCMDRRGAPSATDKRQKKTVVDLALASLDDADAGTNNKPDAAFLFQLFQHLKIFLFAGHDTTASTICWTFHVCERRPDVLARLRAEHDEVLGPDVDRVEEVVLARPHLLNSLPYTTAVIKETLRLHPPALSMRESPPGFMLHKPGYPALPTNGFIIWDGMQVVQRNPEFWPRAHEFVPDRFLVPEGDPLHPPKNGWRPFEQPPRSCIGQELAMLEIKLALVVAVRRFDIELAWDEWDRIHPGRKDVIDGERLYEVGLSTAHPKDGAPMRVRRRKLD